MCLRIGERFDAMGNRMAFNGLRTDKIETRMLFERGQALRESVREADVIPILNEHEVIVVATLEQAVQSERRSRSFRVTDQHVLWSDEAQNLLHVVGHGPIYKHPILPVMGQGVRNRYLGRTDRQHKKVRVGPRINSGKYGESVHSEMTMKLIRPWMRKPYGGYNTYIRMLERMQGKVRRPVRLCVTWTAYWWRFQFLSRAPFLVTVHGKEIGHRSSGMLRWMQEHVYRRAEGIIAISRYTAKELRAQFPEVDASKIQVIHHGLPIMAFPPKSEHGVPVRILSIGQWIERKGFDLLIGSVRRLSKANRVSLDIVTDDQAPTIADPNIRIHRNADEVTKRQLLADADIFVLANRHIGSDFEGFGYVVLEAMQAGLPCVVGRNGGPAEIIREGLDGFVIDSEQTDDLDQAIRTLALDPKLRERMGASAKARAQSEFSEESVLNVLNAYISS